MECFYHAGVPAVGSCRACLKGLCRPCAVELEAALACPTGCEPLARTLVASLQQSLRLQNVSTGLLRSAPGFWLGLTLVALSSRAAAQVQAPVPTLVWAPKPIKTPAYSPPQKPWIKLADLKTRHKGEAAWRELLVDDGRLTAEYVSAPPGATVGRRLHPDTREWFAVVEGEVRVDIEGQTPFVAARGSLVNIPRQTIYALETVGATPSLRFIVNVARAKTLFPQDVEPPPAAQGTSWVAVNVNRRPGGYDEFNQPHLNIHEAARANEKYTGGRFIRNALVTSP